MTEPESLDDRLVRHDVPTPRGVVLLLHGGGEGEVDMAVAGKYAAYVRMVSLHRWVRGALARHGVSSWVLRNRYVDWGARPPGLVDDEPPSVTDAREAIARIRAVHPGRSIVLLGHSMGGRSGLRAADEPGVVGLVGLEPWLPVEESPAPLAGRHVALAASPHDPEVPLATVRAFALRAEAEAASVHVRRIGWNLGPLNRAAGHGMTTALRSWHRFATIQSVRMVDRAEAARRA
ncbi:alpha/beta hydrolase [Nocardioides sp.]|uniref:alpha/beta hydrolase n=1 Tax=Nocardioides sp. TaxID=35761 RepID=UPI0035122497